MDVGGGGVGSVGAEINAVREETFDVSGDGVGIANPSDVAAGDVISVGGGRIGGIGRTRAGEVFHFVVFLVGGGTAEGDLLAGVVGISGATAVGTVFVIFGPPVGGGVKVGFGFETFFVDRVHDIVDFLFYESVVVGGADFSESLVAGETVAGVFEILDQIRILAVDVLEVGTEHPGNLENADAARTVAGGTIIELVPRVAWGKLTAAGGCEFVFPEGGAEETFVVDTTKHCGDVDFVKILAKGRPVFFFRSVATDGGKIAATGYARVVKVDIIVGVFFEILFGETVVGGVGGGDME